MPRQRRSYITKPKTRKSATRETVRWYTIRRILQERVVCGKLEYLVDWADDNITGEAYEPTWAKSCDVTEAAVEEWNLAKTDQQTQATDSAIPADLDNSDDSDDSQPPQTASRRPFKRCYATITQEKDDNSYVAEEHPAKRIRAHFDTTPSEEPAPSFTFTSASSDAAEEENWAERPNAQIAVEIPRVLDLDPSEYHSVHGTQTTFDSSWPISELESQDQRIALSSSLSQKTIPDSQEQSSLEFGTQQEILSPYAGPPLPAGTDELHSSAGTNQTSGCEPITQEHTAGLDKLSESEPTAQAQNESRLAAGVDKTFETEFTSQARDNPPATQQDSNLSQDKAAEGCRETETEIPSRQPDNSGPRDSNSQEQEQSSSKEQNLQIPETTEEETAAEFQDQSAHSHTPTVGGDSQQEERSSEPKLAFLTQPEFEINFVSEPSESLSSRVNESSNLNTNIQSGLKSQALSAEEHDNLNSRVSQAAQIVSGAFEVPGQQSLGSDILSARVPDNTNYNSAYNTSGFDLTSCDLSTKSAIEESSKRKRPSAAEHIARVLQAIDRKEDPIDCIMFDADPQEGSSSGRVSAVTELQKLWDADPPTRTAEDLPKEEPSFTEPTSSTDVQLAADSKAMNSFVDDDWVNQSQPHVPGLPDVSPPSLMPPPLPSATDSLQRLVDDALGITTGPVSQPLLNPESQPLQQATVSPADISKPNEFENTTLALLPSLHAQDPISAETVRSPVGAISMAQLPLATEGFSPSTDQEADSKTYLVTLPFQASIRALYDETLFKDRRAVTKFGEAFTNEIYVEPEASLVKSVDKLLNQLQNLCDYPQDALGTALDEMRPSQRVKYSLDASPKLNFVFELLQGLESGANILIMARNPHILRILGEVAEVLGVDFACVSTGHSPENGYLASAVRATLALPVEKVDLSDFDIVIAYDNSFINAHAAQQSPDGQLGKKSPLVLNLITAYSIEHIDYFVTKNQGELERKNALLFGIVKARDLLNDPPQMVEPHEAAKTFYDFVNEITDSIRWEPEDLPDQILDAYIATQTQLSVEMSPSADNGRKRKLDDGGVDGESKKMRLVLPEFDEPPLPDEVQDMLAKIANKVESKSPTKARVSVSLEALKALAEQMAEFERIGQSQNREPQYTEVIVRLEKRVKEYERTAGKMYESNRSAVQDRTTFEGKARKAESALESAVEAAKRSDAKHLKKIEELEAAVARLTNGSDTPSVVGETEKLLQEARDKVRLLEKRLETSHKNEEYARQLYQDTSSSATAMRAEINELKAQNEELKKVSSSNLKDIHEMQTKNNMDAYLREIAGLKTRVKDRETELDRVRDELRQLKNGRRETRQASVPRSPRMGLMSPRPPRGSGIGGPVSRGASPGPAPGSGSDVATSAGQQTGNGRWSYLRE